MGWVTKNGYKYYKITKTVGRTINAAGNEVPVKKEFYGRTKKECEKNFQEFQKKKEMGIENRNQYFGILAEMWIEEFFKQDGSIKDGTKRLYLTGWKRIKEMPLYHMPLNEVTAITIQNTYNELNKLGCPSSTIGNINKLMRRYYRYLEMQGLARNITGALVVPKDSRAVEEKEVVVWNDEEVRAIFNGFDMAQDGFRIRFLLVLAYYTGCRISELLALKYSDFTGNSLRIERQISEDLEATKVLSTPKTSNSIRNIPITDQVIDELKLHQLWHKKEMLAKGYRTEYVFTTDSGKWYDDRNIQRACVRYYKRIGIEPKKFHTYRHTFGTNLHKQGVDIVTASKLMGHANINITNKYYIAVADDKKMDAIIRLAEIVNV